MLILIMVNIKCKVFRVLISAVLRFHCALFATIAKLMTEKGSNLALGKDGAGAHKYRRKHTKTQHFNWCYLNIYFGVHVDEVVISENVFNNTSQMVLLLCALI